MIKRLLSATLLVLSLVVSVFPVQVAAYDTYNGVDCGAGGVTVTQAHDPASSAVCTSKTSKDPLTGSDGVLAKIINIVSVIAGAAAVIIIIIGGLRYVTSNGDSAKISSAKNTVINALIGIIIIILAKAIIDFVLVKI